MLDCTEGSMCCQKAGKLPGTCPWYPTPTAVLGAAGGGGRGGAMKLVTAGACGASCSTEADEPCAGAVLGDGRKSNNRRGATPLPLASWTGCSAPALHASGPGRPPVLGIGDGCDSRAASGNGICSGSSSLASGAKSGGTVLGVPRTPVVCLIGVP